MVFSYDGAERGAVGKAPGAGEGRRFETWTGHLASGSLGPGVKTLGKLSEPVQTLKLRSLEVVRAPKELLGAELRVYTGVDTAERRIHADRVRDGASIDLSGNEPIPLYQDLDGELWLHGTELDSVTSDDPLPWGLRPLARGAEGGFREGEGQLRVAGETAELVLRYEVSRPGA